MNAKKVIGFVLIFGAIFGFGKKFISGMSGNFDHSAGLYIFGIMAFFLFLGIRRVLQN